MRKIAEKDGFVFSEVEASDIVQSQTKAVQASVEEPGKYSEMRKRLKASGMSDLEISNAIQKEANKEFGWR